MDSDLGIVFHRVAGDSATSGSSNSKYTPTPRVMYEYYIVYDSSNHHYERKRLNPVDPLRHAGFYIYLMVSFLPCAVLGLVRRSSGPHLLRP